MICIFAALHIFMELAIVGSLSKILEEISKRPSVYFKYDDREERGDTKT